jgi:hypothetical protein
MSFTEKYRLTCTLSFGDIYGQIIVWLIVIFASVAAALGLMDSPLYAFFAIGLILVLSLPFLLFAFVTTLLNHIEFTPLSQIENAAPQRGSAQVSTAS